MLSFALHYGVAEQEMYLLNDRDIAIDGHLMQSVSLELCHFNKKLVLFKRIANKKSCLQDMCGRADRSGNKKRTQPNETFSERVKEVGFQVSVLYYLMQCV